MSESAENGNGIVEPGQSQVFIYTGMQDPYQVILENKSTTEQANFIMQGGVGDGEPGWKLYGTIPAGGNVSYFVNWGEEGLITNQGDFDSAIAVGGYGIFAK